MWDVKRATEAIEVRLRLTLVIHIMIVVSVEDPMIHVRIKILQILKVVEALGPLPIDATFTTNIPPGAGSAARAERHTGRLQKAIPESEPGRAAH